MRARRLSVAALLTIASLTLVVPASQAAAPTCHGLDATILGTEEADTLVGTEGPDVVVLLGGDDTFSGRGGADVICGGDGSDHLYPGAGDDVVHAGEGWDYVHEGRGDDRLDGGPGRDRLMYSNTDAHDLRLDARTGTATSSEGEDTFTSFLEYVGSPNPDVLIGSRSAEYLHGYDGAGDSLYGLGGRDRIVALGNSSYVDAGTGSDLVEVDGYGTLGSRVVLGDGNDLITYRGHAGSSLWDGGTGVDTVSLRVVGYGFDVDLDQGYVSAHRNGDEAWVLDRFENVVGSEGSDVITGNALPNRLEGRGGNDRLAGRGGADVLVGNGGTDTVDGGTNDDTCYAERETAC